VNKHIPRGYEECLVWGTIGWTIPVSRYPDTYNKQPICYVAVSSQENYRSLYLMGAFWSAEGGAGEEGEAGRFIGEQGGRQAGRQKAPAIRAISGRVPHSSHSSPLVSPFQDH
jgi:hypothetical protein